MMSGWAHHIEPIKGTRHSDYHTRTGQCQQNSAKFRYDSSSAPQRRAGASRPNRRTSPHLAELPDIGSSGPAAAISRAASSRIHPAPAQPENQCIIYGTLGSGQE